MPGASRRREGGTLFMNLYSAIVLITGLTLAITVSDILSNRLTTREDKRAALIACLIIALPMLAEWVSVSLDGAPAQLRSIHVTAKLLELILAPAIGVAVAFAYGDAKHPELALTLVAAHAVFQCLALGFEWVFRVDAENGWQRQELFVIYALVFVLSVAYAFSSVVIGGKAYQIGVDAMLVLTLLLVTAGIWIMLVYPRVRITYLCIAVGNLLLYIRHYKVMLQVDAVTGLLNRRCYDVNITDMGSRSAIIMLDIDRFKRVNDTYGHSVGDLCLRNVAEELTAVYGKYGLCYRIGGDEFCVILQDGIEKTELLNKLFLARIRRLREKDRRMPGVSMGCVYYDAAASDIRDVLREADAMLYQDKSRNSGCDNT